MFPILQKPQEFVNAEDLETLQNDIEKRLAHVVTNKWKLEQELDALNNLSPDPNNQQLAHFSAINSTDHSSTTTTNNTNVTTTTTKNITSTQPSGKLRNHSLKVANQAAVDAIDANSSDSTTIFMSNNATTSSSNDAKEQMFDNESVSSESSMTSNLTGSTIIANFVDFGSHNQQPTTSSSINSSSSNNNKRSLKNSTSDRPPKRFRPNGNSSMHSHPKRLPHFKQQRIKQEDPKPPLKKQILKNEAPDKLWPFVDQFCSAPTGAQIKELERMIKALENDRANDLYKQTPSSKQQSSNSNATAYPNNFNSNSNASNSSKSNNPRKKLKGDGSLGPLTQRAVSIVMEDWDDDTKLSAGGDDPNPTPNKRSKAVGDVGNAKSLEKNIRQTLEDYSILSQQDDIPYAHEEDEQTRQLRAYQHELHSIQTHTQYYMQILLKRAKKHIELEKEREKLREASADVIAVYQKLIQAKQRKKSPTKKEKDAAVKALKVHEAIFKKCDELYLSNRLVTGQRDFIDF